MFEMKWLVVVCIFFNLNAQSVFDELRKKIKTQNTGNQSGLNQAQKAPSGAESNRSIGLPGKAVVTSHPFKSFAEAEAKSIGTVTDGESVYFHVKLPDQLSKYAGKWYKGNDPNIAHADKIGLNLEVGPVGERSTIYARSVLLLRQEELMGDELHIDLAPGEVRPMALSLWLNTVGQGMAGIWKNEIRLVGHKKINIDGATRWEKEYLAIAPLTASVSDGVSAYQKMSAAYRKRFDLGDPSWNDVPPPGSLKDSAVIKRVLAIIKKEIVGEVGRLHFTVDNWYEQRNALGQLERDTATAIVTTKSEGKYWVRFIDVSRTGAGVISASIRPPQEIARDKF